jgi:hypothetical protein
MGSHRYFRCSLGTEVHRSSGLVRRGLALLDLISECGQRVGQLDQDTV